MLTQLRIQIRLHLPKIFGCFVVAYIFFVARRSNVHHLLGSNERVWWNKFYYVCVCVCFYVVMCDVCAP